MAKEDNPDYVFSSEQLADPGLEQKAVGGTGFFGAWRGRMG